MAVGLAGRYRVRLRFPDQPWHYDSGWFPNLITDAGLDRIGSGPYLEHCVVGASAAEPLATDTLLGAPTAAYDSACITSGVAGAPCYYGWQRRVYTFTHLPDSGQLTEVGVGWLDTGSSEYDYSSSDPAVCASSSELSSEQCYDAPVDLTDLVLFSRTLLPRPVRNVKSQQLEISYELRLYPELQDHAAYLFLDLTTYVRVTTRPALLGSDLWALTGDEVKLSPCHPQPALFGEAVATSLAKPAGDAYPCTDSRTKAYTPGSHQRLLQAYWAPYSDTPPDGIRSVLFYTQGYGAWQAGFSPPIRDRNCYEKLVLSLQLSWARYDGSSNCGVGSSSSGD